MGDHILPQVLLRGFAYNSFVNKQDAQIKVLTQTGVSIGLVKDLYQQNMFYSRETEAMLDHDYEQPFGIIKKKLIESLIVSDLDEYSLSTIEYFLLIKFFVILWRRNEVHIEKTVGIVKAIMEDSYLRPMLKPENQNKTSDELTNSIKQNLQEEVYHKIISETNNDDPTVQKTFHLYTPIIVINHCEITFPLHNKYATAQQRINEDPEYPRMTIEPITNRIYMVFKRQESHYDEKTQVPIKVIHLHETFDVEAMIGLYLIPGLKSIVVDDSNWVFVNDIMDNIFDKRKLVGKRKLQSLLQKLEIEL
ncbi:MAG: hypothetical protein WC479_09430 [Candidatus Izemoplasmatales bacterium]|jgi:hypothetical protein